MDSRFQRPGLKKFWSEIGSAFGEPNHTPPPKILRSTPSLGDGKGSCCGDIQQGQKHCVYTHEKMLHGHVAAPRYLVCAVRCNLSHEV